MTHSRRRPEFGLLIYFALTFVLGLYFAFASIQGDFGLFRRVEINAQATELTQRLAVLKDEVAVMQNKTRRLSDQYLDLDLLDQQARDVLGLVRSDEIVLR